MKDDFELLEFMLAESAKHKGPCSAGPYWLDKTKSATAALRLGGLSAFRSGENNLGISYSDAPCLDVRHSYRYGPRAILRWISQQWPFQGMWSSQTAITRAQFKRSLRFAQKILATSARVRHLLGRWSVPDSLSGGCSWTVWAMSIHYLEILDQLDRLCMLGNRGPVLEIGGGSSRKPGLLWEQLRRKNHEQRRNQEGPAAASGCG